MADTINNANERINLQNGEYCHLTKNYLIVSSKRVVNESEITCNLSKTKNTKKTRIVVNAVLTVLVMLAAIITNFYPLVLVMFVLLWDLRQLKRYRIPINKTKVIPLKNITEVHLKKGMLNFNYMDVYLEYNGVASFVPLQLYDSNSTLMFAQEAMKKLGVLTEFPSIDAQKMEGYLVPINETSGYVLKENKLYYTEKMIHQKSRMDSYEYLRIIAYFTLFLLLFIIAAKINTIATGYTNYVDYVALGLFIFALKLPLKYTKKALPNVITLLPSTVVQEEKKKMALVIPQKYAFNLKVYFPKKHFPEDFKATLKQVTS